MAIKKEIFKAIQTRVQEQAPSIKYIDKLFGQPSNLSNYVIAYPAVLIEFTNFLPISNLQNVQGATIEVKVHLFFENYSDSNLGSIDQEQALAYFDCIDELNEALNTLSGENFSTLQRIGEEEDNDHDNIIQTILTYATTGYDKKTTNKKTKLTEEITPKAQFVKTVIKQDLDNGGFKV